MTTGICSIKYVSASIFTQGLDDEEEHPCVLRRRSREMCEGLDSDEETQVEICSQIQVDVGDLG